MNAQLPRWVDLGLIPLLNLIVATVVSRLTPPPSAATRALVAGLRLPGEAAAPAAARGD